MPRLSLIVITKNEEASLERCLQSAAGIADEIVVVDSGSTDRTREIAAEFGAKILESADWPGFGPQKQRAQNAASGDWILSLDADEWMREDLVREIAAVIEDPSAAAGYRIPRRNRFRGHIVRFGGWWPDYVLRLYRRDKGRFNDNLVHESVIVEGEVRKLKNPIEHNTIVSAEDAEGKIERYSEIASRELLARGRQAGSLNARLRGGTAYLRSFIFQLGFLDGKTGHRVARYQARYTYKKWAKTRAANLR
jgi:glycosyltransferase involved in cell wall biosynthesis